MLFREPSPEEPAPLANGPSDGKSVADGKLGKSLSEPVPATKPKLSDQGLYLFSLFTYSPRYNDILPFYFHTGLVYKGLIPTRDTTSSWSPLGLVNKVYTILKPCSKKEMSSIPSCARPKRPPGAQRPPRDFIFRVV